MAVIKEKRISEPREYEETVAVICELCGKRGTPKFDGRGFYDHEEVEVKVEEGDSYLAALDRKTKA